MISKQELIDFEKDISEIFESGTIKGPVHLVGNNEDFLISIFKNIKEEDSVFSTWRSHYHALLKGVPKDIVKEKILKGDSITMHFPEFKVFTSAIVGGVIPIATGAALGVKLNGSKEHIWCFIGDMAFETGIFHECYKYSIGYDLPITFVVEDNGFSTSTPTKETWGPNFVPSNHNLEKVIYYKYERPYPHQGIGKWVIF